MYILTDVNDVIIYVTKTVEELSNNQIKVDNGTLIYQDVNYYSCADDVYAIDVVQKQCYTVEKGYYPNPNYVAPVDEQTEFDLIKAQQAFDTMMIEAIYAKLETLENGGTN